jgi:hypothetical protein
MKSKILFWLGSDYTHFCLAHSLQKKIDCDVYAILDITERPKQFFQNQKLVNFNKIWFFHDYIKKNSSKPDLNYLAKFEKKYNIHLWKLVQNERIFLYFNFHKFSYDEILKILECECRFFESILDEIKPDFFFTKLPSFHHLELFYEMCKNTGVHVQAINYGMLGQKCIITQEHENLDIITEISKIKTKNRNFNDLQNYLHPFDLTKQLETKIIKPGKTFKDSFNAAKEYFLHSDSKNTQTHYPYYGRTKFKVFFYYVNDFLKTKFRELYMNKNLVKLPSYDTPFVYFPLHLEMERSQLITAPFFVNQLEVVRTIAKSLPINYKLYVKEHPAQIGRGWRSSNEYKEFMKIPNVTLLHHSVQKEDIFQKCSLVITIAGSAGFEASFYGKPVITFTDLNYSVLNSVSTIKNLNELPELIKKSLAKKIEPFDLDKFLTLLETNSTNFDLADFITKYKEEFFYGGNLVDVTISEDKMKSFLTKNSLVLDILADAHIKKMNLFKEKKI